MQRPEIISINAVIDCAEGQAGTLAQFYSSLLGWAWTHPAQNGWAAITAESGMVFAFQEVEAYTPPTWPYEQAKQGQMIHFDFWVKDLEEGVRYAESLGAVQAKAQFFKSSRTMLDPAGHTFCIDTDGED